MPWIVRGVASCSISSFLMFWPTTGVVIGAGSSAVTCTDSATPAARIAMFVSTTRPRGTAALRVMVANPLNSNVIW